jgi:hypothetical protein
MRAVFSCHIITKNFHILNGNLTHLTTVTNYVSVDPLLYTVALLDI